MSSKDDLLQPSLTAERADATAIYSAQAGFFTAFFGGPAAAIGMAGLNSWRLGRLQADAPLYLAVFVVYAVAVWWAFESPAKEMLVEHLGRRGPQLVIRALALAAFGLFYLRHRSHYRNMEMMDIKPPNGWRAGLPMAIGGTLVTIALAMAIAGFNR